MESRTFFISNTSVKHLHGVPFKVTEMDHSFLCSVESEIKELSSLIRLARCASEKECSVEISVAMNSIYKLSSRIDHRLSEAIHATEKRNTVCGKSIADRIHDMRVLRGLTPEDVARKLLVTKTCLSAWESGITVPSCDKLIPLSEVLDCDPLWLLTGLCGETGNE